MSRSSLCFTEAVKRGNSIGCFGAVIQYSCAAMRAAIKSILSTTCSFMRFQHADSESLRPPRLDQTWSDVRASILACTG